MSHSTENARSRLVHTLFPSGIPRLWCPLLTHYHQDGTIDRERISAHIRHMRPWISAFLAPGSTGDGWELTPAEADQLAFLLLEEAQRQEFSLMVGVLRTEPGSVVPAIREFLGKYVGPEAGSAADTSPRAKHTTEVTNAEVTTVALSEAASAALADRRICGFTVTPPRGRDLDQAFILQELEAIAATGVPLAIYQLPQITENEMAPATVADLVARFPNIYLLKDTSGGDAIVMSGVELGNLFLVRGAEGDYAQWHKRAGGAYDGFLLSTTNSFAAELGQIIAYLQEGKVEEAEDLSRRVSSVVAELFIAAGKLPFGNPFANANKAFDHHFAWGPGADETAPPMTHSGNALPRELLHQARQALHRVGLDPGRGYMNGA